MDIKDSTWMMKIHFSLNLKPDTAEKLISYEQTPCLFISDYQNVISKLIKREAFSFYPKTYC